MPWIVRLRIERGPDLLDRLQELRQALEGEELALQRHQNRVRRRHRVDGDEIERRRAVDQHIGVGRRPGPSLSARERLAQPVGAVALVRDLELEAGEVDGRRADVQPRHRGRLDRVAHRHLADQDVVGRALPALAVDAEPGRGIALRVEVDDQHVLADRGERGAEVDRGRGLADAALLVGERDHARRRMALVSRLRGFVFGHGVCRSAAPRISAVQPGGPPRCGLPHWSRWAPAWPRFSNI